MPSHREMKSVVAVVSALILLLAACSPQDRDSGVDDQVTPQSKELSDSGLPKNGSDAKGTSPRSGS